MLLHCCCTAASLTQVETVEDYDLYCHYVAGLVGIGLSQLFGECVMCVMCVYGQAE